MEDYDVELVDKWLVPEDLRAVIAMPNIPRPLHLVNPRNLLGATTWNHMRRACYAKADMTCEICGKKQEPGHCDAHEIYDIDYKKGTATFVKVVCLCRTCHRLGIHTGRCVTLHKEGNPLMPKEALLEGAENAFTIISSYNQAHPDAPLRAYATWLEYLKCEDLKVPMEELIKKYDIKFYMEKTKRMAKWADWELIIGSKHYKTPYANQKEWEEAMKNQGKRDNTRKAENKFVGGVYDDLDKILKENIDTSINE